MQNLILPIEMFKIDAGGLTDCSIGILITPAPRLFQIEQDENSFLYDNICEYCGSQTATSLFGWCCGVDAAAGPKLGQFVNCCGFCHRNRIMPQFREMAHMWRRVFGSFIEFMDKDIARYIYALYLALQHRQGFAQNRRVVIPKVTLPFSAIQTFDKI